MHRTTRRYSPHRFQHRVVSIERFSKECRKQKQRSLRSKTKDMISSTWLVRQSIKKHSLANVFLFRTVYGSREHSLAQTEMLRLVFYHQRRQGWLHKSMDERHRVRRRRGLGHDALATPVVPATWRLSILGTPHDLRGRRVRRPKSSRRLLAQMSRWRIKVCSPSIGWVLNNPAVIHTRNHSNMIMTMHNNAWQ